MHWMFYLFFILLGLSGFPETSLSVGCLQICVLVSIHGERLRMNQRSTEPMITSMEPRIAMMSATLCPLRM